MKTEVKDPQRLTQKETWARSLAVLELLDGISVVEVHAVLKHAESLMNSYTRHDVSSAWFQQAVAALPNVRD